MTVTQLRRILPGIEVEDDPYTIGYWSRWAGAASGHASSGGVGSSRR